MIQCSMDTAKLHKLSVAICNVQDWGKSLRQSEKKLVSGSRENVYI